MSWSPILLIFFAWWVLGKEIEKLEDRVIDLEDQVEKLGGGDDDE